MRGGARCAGRAGEPAWRRWPRRNRCCWHRTDDGIASQPRDAWWRRRGREHCRQRGVRGRIPDCGPGEPGRDVLRPAAAPGHGLDRALPARRRKSCVPWPKNSISTTWPWTMRSQGISGPSWNTTAKRSSWSCALPGIWTIWRRSSSARSMSSAGRTSWSRCAVPNRRIWPVSATGWSPSLRSWPSVRTPCSTRSWTRSWMSTSRLLPAWKTTSMKSRTTSSPRTRACPAGSTNSPARSSCSSGRRHR